MSDLEVEKLTQNLIAVHWIVVGLGLIAWKLLPLFLGLSSEVVAAHFFGPTF